MRGCEACGSTRKKGEVVCPSCGFMDEPVLIHPTDEVIPVRWTYKGKDGKPVGVFAIYHNGKLRHFGPGGLRLGSEVAMWQEGLHPGVEGEGVPPGVA